MFRKTNIALWLLWVYLFCSCSLLYAQTSGGTVFTNQASAGYSFAGETQPITTSNETNSVVPSVCALAATPDGSVTAPARRVAALPGATVYLPYTLTNTGNQTLTFNLATNREAASTVTPLSVEIINDLNSNGADDGEGVITDISLARNGAANLLVKVTIPADAALSGLIYLDFIAACADNPALRDDTNVSVVEVLEGGITGLRKTATPGSGAFVTPSQAITYDISFSANERVLNNLVIRDVLDASLATPTLTLTVNGALVSGASYDAATREISATLTTLQPGDDVVLTVGSSVLPATSGAVTIRNRATVDAAGGTFTTNETTHTTPASCAVNLSPSGTLSTPAYSRTALPGETLVFPYTLSNLGNVVNDFNVSATILNSNFSANVSLVFDTNNNGAVDAGETQVTRVNDIASGDTANVLLVIAVPTTATISGDVFVDVVASCAGDPSIRDSSNVTRVSVPLGGLSNPTKRAEPAAGTTLFPGSTVTYFIEFVSNGRDLTDTTVTDALDTFSSAPTSFSNGTITDSVSGLSAAVVGRYDAASRTLSWNFAALPAGMRVRLEFTTQVRNDVTIPPGAELRNVAVVSGVGDPPLTTNPVTHPLAPLEILLQKTATPNQVLIGETLFYTLTVTNPSESVEIETLELTDDLPDVLRYRADTSVVTLPDGTKQNLEPNVTGQQLVWSLPRLLPGQTVGVTFGTTVLAEALDVDEIVNTASVVASDANGRAVADADAAANTVIDKKPFLTTSVLLGTVFVDHNVNNIYEQDTDEKVSGVRLYLSDGQSVVTDSDGRYTFLNLETGTETLKVDNTTLPARLLRETISENKAGLWRVRLEPGLIVRQDVPLQPPGAELSVAQYLTVSRGSVQIQKYLVHNGTESKIIMDITSREALKNLVITDTLPLTVEKIGDVTASESADINALTFALGDIEAGYAVRLEYPVQINGSLKGVLIAPGIEWSVR
jgi:fimbrial isopeptide formation D2 family protein